jgi:hypothetical protein
MRRRTISGFCQRTREEHLNICVIGNSHAAALKKSSFQLNCNSLDYYAIPGAGAPDLLLKNGRLFPDYDSDKGVTYPDFKLGEWVSSNIPQVEIQGLELDNYDLIVYSGVGLPALRSSNRNAVNQVVCPFFLPIHYDQSSCEKSIVSLQAYERLIENELESAANICSLRLLLAHFKGPILLQHFPVPSKQLLNQPDFDYASSVSISSLIKWYYKKQIEFVENLIVDHSNASYLFDVFELVDESGFTQNRLSTLNDAWHMNHLYGDEVFKYLQIYLDNL